MIRNVTLTYEKTFCLKKIILFHQTKEKTINPVNQTNRKMLAATLNRDKDIQKQVDVKITEEGSIVKTAMCYNGWISK